MVATSEAAVADAINTATAEIAGISDAPSPSSGVPDLTLVDLPGITRIPLKDIYDQVAKIIMEYIAPKESIILNVLSATVDFPTCESIRMSQQVDCTGERTLAVATKVDKNPEGLLEKVTMDDETYDQARAEEARLFKNHPLLSKIDKSMVGILVLAQRLMQIQASIIAKCLPNIVKQINKRLIHSSTKLDQMPPDLNNTCDAVRVFFHIVKKVCTSLEKILVRAEFDDFPDDSYFHGTARIAEMLKWYAKKLPTKCPMRSDELFLMEEVRVVEETMGINLPNFLPRSAFHVILKKKEYVEDLVMKILLQHSENFSQEQSSCRRAIQSLMEKTRAFDLRAWLTTYWKSIVLRLIDGLALHVLRGVKRLVENDLEEELVD
uniref:Dynamin-type G domain-containing protein n=1 Tax=Setaria italica TaxID=4555 RepID=K4AI31_SETIT